MDPGNNPDPGRSASALAAVASPSLAPALEAQEVEKLVHDLDWKIHPGFHERIAAQQYCYSQVLGAGVHRCRTPSETSSMVVSAISIHSHRDAVASSISGSHERYSHAPSLGSYSSAKSDSVRTSRADSILEQHVLEEGEDGVMQTPSPHSVVGRLACSCNFLGCDYRSDDLEEWDIHSQHHFHGKLPREVHCPFACDWTGKYLSGDEAWRQRTVHIVANHRNDIVDTTGRPPKALIEYLWRIRVVDDAQKKELIRKGRLNGVYAYKLSHRTNRR